MKSRLKKYGVIFINLIAYLTMPIWILPFFTYELISLGDFKETLFNSDKYIWE